MQGNMDDYHVGDRLLLSFPDGGIRKVRIGGLFPVAVLLVAEDGTPSLVSREQLRSCAAGRSENNLQFGQAPTVP
jgi:hypothetical protein